MENEECSRRLQAYMFGKATPAERQRLAESALESAERALEFAQAEEIREQFADPQYRSELIGLLPAVRPAWRESWWSALFRPRFVLALAGSAALVAGILLIRDFRAEREQPQIAQGPPREARPDDRVEALGQSGEGRDLTAAEMASLFALPESAASDCGLTLPGGSRYRAGDRVTASLMLPVGGRVYALVRGPEGSIREVYATAAADRVLSQGAHSFSFTAAGRMDPPSGGRSRLRVFVTGEGAAPASGPERWVWLKENSRFQEAGYDVYVP